MKGGRGGKATLFPRNSDCFYHVKIFFCFALLKDAHDTSQQHYKSLIILFYYSSGTWKQTNKKRFKKNVIKLKTGILKEQIII